MNKKAYLSSKLPLLFPKAKQNDLITCNPGKGNNEKVTQSIRKERGSESRKALDDDMFTCNFSVYFHLIYIIILTDEDIYHLLNQLPHLRVRRHYSLQ